MSGKEIVATLVALFVGFSGWAKVMYDHFSTKPKIKGKILAIIVGKFTHNNQEFTSFLTYLYLVNHRKSPVHLLDFELEADLGDGFYQLDRVYGLEKIPSFTFLTPSGENIPISGFHDKLIYKQNRPVEYGVPIHGYVLFAGNRSFYNASILRYRVTVIDALENRHSFIIWRTDLQRSSIFRLEELGGLRLPSANIFGRP